MDSISLSRSMTKSEKVKLTEEGVGIFKSVSIGNKALIGELKFLD